MSLISVDGAPRGCAEDKGCVHRNKGQKQSALFEGFGPFADGRALRRPGEPSAQIGDAQVAVQAQRNQQGNIAGEDPIQAPVPATKRGRPGSMCVHVRSRRPGVSVRKRNPQPRPTFLLRGRGRALRNWKDAPARGCRRHSGVQRCSSIHFIMESAISSQPAWRIRKCPRPSNSRSAVTPADGA